MFSVALYCAYSNFRCETTLSHISLCWEKKSVSNSLFLLTVFKLPPSLFPALPLTYIIVMFAQKVCLFSPSPSPCRLHLCFYLSLTIDFFIWGERCVPLSCAWQNSQTGNYHLCLHSLNKQMKSERWRGKIQWPDRGEMWKNRCHYQGSKCLPEDNRRALIWILIYHSAFTLANGAIVAMPMPSSPN